MKLTAKQRAVLQRISDAGGRRLLLQEEGAGNARIIRELLAGCLIDLGADPVVKDRKEGGPAATVFVTDKGRAALT